MSWLILLITTLTFCDVKGYTAKRCTDETSKKTRADGNGKNK